jgi:hypothetical protein
MKKLLAILVLGLLWCNVSNALDKPIWTQKQINNNLRSMEQTYDKVLKQSGHLGFYVLAQSTNPYSTAYAYVGHKTDKNKAIKKALKDCRNQDNTPCVITRDGNQIIFTVAEKISKDRKITKKATTNTNDKITQAKQICKDLGFKTNTEKFADCALKMMSIQFEATNKVASSSGGTKQEIIVKHKNDYDIFDAMLDISNSMLSNNSSSSSSSSNSGTSCFAQTTNSGHTIINCD